MGNICGAQDRAEEVGIRDGEDGGGERQSGRKDPTRRCRTNSKRFCHLLGSFFAFLRRSVLFSNVSLSCRTALSHLEGFGERLARERFRTDLHSHHLDWMHVGYDWLLSKEEVRSHSSSSNDNNVMTSSFFRSPRTWASASPSTTSAPLPPPTTADDPPPLWTPSPLWAAPTHYYRG